METFKIIFSVSTESNTEITVLSTFDNLKSAKKDFKKELKNIYRGKTSDYDSVIESLSLEKYINEEYEDEITGQTIYSEGIIDRMNYKGNYAVNYYSYATFNGKELMHEMYFQGKKENWGRKRKVPQSQLKNWYFRN